MLKTVLATLCGLLFILTSAVAVNTPPPGGNPIGAFDSNFIYHWLTVGNSGYLLVDVATGATGGSGSGAPPYIVVHLRYPGYYCIYPAPHICVNSFGCYRKYYYA